MACWIFNFEEILSLMNLNGYQLIFKSSNNTKRLCNVPESFKAEFSTNLLFKLL